MKWGLQSRGSIVRLPRFSLSLNVLNESNTFSILELCSRASIKSISNRWDFGNQEEMLNTDGNSEPGDIWFDENDGSFRDSKMSICTSLISNFQVEEKKFWLVNEAFLCVQTRTHELQQSQTRNSFLINRFKLSRYELTAQCRTSCVVLNHLMWA